MSNQDYGGGNETVILRIFEQGKRFTEELLKENERLRMLVARLRTEGQDAAASELQAEVARISDKLRVVEDEVGRLRQDNNDLRHQFRQVEDENREFADRYMEVEQLYSNLIHLYVAGDRLHSTLDCREVIQIVKEIVINMVGAFRFGIYLVDDRSRSLVLVSEEQLESQHATIALDGTKIGKSVNSGDIYVADGGDDQPEAQACVPLIAKGRVLGAIVIFDLLSHKMSLDSRDMEIFNLLSSHAATAIYNASLATMSQPDKLPVSAVIELLHPAA